MYRSLLFFLFAAILFIGCGAEPTPEEKEMAALRAKLEAAHVGRFDRDGSVSQSRSAERKKGSEDPTAYIYKGKVLSEKSEKQWKKAGISNTEYPKWAALGMDPKEVLSWKKLDISYAAITVYKTKGYTPKTAGKFMQKQFFTRPDFYARFGTPVYEFDTICQSVVQRQQAPFAFLEERCLPYMEKAYKNEVIGHLLDEAKLTKGPLVIEYLAELRRLAETNSKIQSGMEVTIEEFIEDEDTENFVFLFPLLKNEPTQEEMDFIDAHKLPLQNKERFFSFQNPQYWKNRAEAEAAAAEYAARQEELLRAKKDKERKLAKLKLAKAEAMAKQKARKEAQYKRDQQAKKIETARRKKAKALCGEYLSPAQLSGQNVLLEGDILFTVEDRGSKMFGYGVQAREDSKIYFIRDPKNAAEAKVSSSVSWRVKTMGRTEALSQGSSKVFVYDKKSKTKFTMALYVDECEVK